VGVSGLAYDIVGSCVAAGAATLLVVSGAAKASRPEPIASTISALGVSVARPVAIGRALGMFELGLAFLIVLVRSVWVGLAVGLFGLVVAGAGLIALRSGSEIPCNCFGESSKPLGKRQLLQLPAWLVVAWSASVEPSAFASAATERLAVLAGCVLVASALLHRKLLAATNSLARRRRALPVSLWSPGGHSW